MIQSFSKYLLDAVSNEQARHFVRLWRLCPMGEGKTVRKQRKTLGNGISAVKKIGRFLCKGIEA